MDYGVPVCTEYTGNILEIFNRIGLKLIFFERDESTMCLRNTEHGAFTYLI